MDPHPGHHCVPSFETAQIHEMSQKNHSNERGYNVEPYWLQCMLLSWTQDKTLVKMRLQAGMEIKLPVRPG